MQRRGQVVFSGVILLIALWALYATRDWSIKTALYPRVVGVPLLALAAAEFVLSLRGVEPDGSARPMDVQMSVVASPAVALRRTLAVTGWLAGFFFGILLLGFPVAVPVFVFAYLKSSRESWLVSILLAAAAWLAFYALFIRLLHLPFGSGLLL